MSEKEIVYLNQEEMELILEALDYKIDKDNGVIGPDNKKVICPFTEEPTTITKISVMPGSLILMNTSPLTLSEYFYQYPND